MDDIERRIAALPLYRRILEQIGLWLENGLIHADLHHGNVVWRNGELGCRTLAIADSCSGLGDNQPCGVEFGLGLAMENIALQAVDLGLIAHMMGGFDKTAAHEKFVMPDDVRPLVPRGVTLCNARGVHDASTAELAVALVLAGTAIGWGLNASTQESGRDKSGTTGGAEGQSEGSERLRGRDLGVLDREP